MARPTQDRTSEDETRKHEQNGSAEVHRLRDRIDRGGAADKTAFKDPAAAPLGTDAEAAGASPTREEAAIAAEAESKRAVASDLRGPAARQSPSLLRPLVILLALLVILLLAGLLFAL
jgi:hypothetical protein